jgi:hypothetical protein
MHGLRSRILAGESAAAPPAPAEEACRRKGARDPSRPQSDRIRDDRRVEAQRKDKRLREVVERATIFYGGKRSMVRVINVSASGLTVESAVGPGVGEALTIALDGREPVEGVVRWVRRGRIGIDVGEGRIGVQPD